MKKVLYITPKEVPYRTTFFNLLSEKCDLTVMYESSNPDNRNDKWAKSIKTECKHLFLDEKNDKFINKFVRAKKIIKENRFDIVIIGAINTKIESALILWLKTTKIDYFINIDGEYFLSQKSLKSIIKKLLISNASAYIVAGHILKNRFIEETRFKNVYSYSFSSMTNKEVNNSKDNKNKNNKVLVVGQMVPAKGLEVALATAKIDSSIKYLFIGSGKKSEELIRIKNKLGLENVEIIPFLQKQELYAEYQRCKMFLLPSIKECWGLVINEAASFGCPIISTKGSGAAIEFLTPQYEMFLANPNSPEDLYLKICKLLKYKEIDNYKKYLKTKSRDYTIEKMVVEHLNIMEKYKNMRGRTNG